MLLSAVSDCFFLHFRRVVCLNHTGTDGSSMILCLCSWKNRLLCSKLWCFFFKTAMKMKFASLMVKFVIFRILPKYRTIKKILRFAQVGLTFWALAVCRCTCIQSFPIASHFTGSDKPPPYRTIACWQLTISIIYCVSCVEQLRTPPPNTSELHVRK